MNPGSVWLIAAGALSTIASMIHIACIVFGARWFRFFGAPEPLIVNYENGAMGLVWMTAAISAILAIWAAFALSAAGLIARLPLLRTALVIITAIYLARGLVLVPALMQAPYPGSTFDLWSSAIVLVYGIVHAVGLRLAWTALGPKTAPA